MSDEEPSVPEGVLTSAKDQLDDEEISLADNEEILHALSELTPVYENDRSYFVLGNYDREPIRRLNLVVDRLNRRQNAYAFRMVDAMKMLTPASGGSLLPVWTGTGFAADGDLVAVSGRRLHLAPTTFLEQRD